MPPRSASSTGKTAAAAAAEAAAPGETGERPVAAPPPSRRRVAFFTIDAFASAPFAGNPAAVVLVTFPLTDAERQRIARELNLSETAFVEVDGRGDERGADGGGGSGAGGGGGAFATASRFVLRWFTPTTEVTLCGHATLAAAHVLASELGNTSPELRFRTVMGAGELVVRRHGGGRERRAAAGAAGAALDGTGGGGASAADDGDDVDDEDEDTRGMLEMSLPMAQATFKLPPVLETEDAQRALVRALGLELASDSRAAGRWPPEEGRLAARAVLFAPGGGLNYVLVNCALLGPSRGPPGARAIELLRNLAPDRGALLSAVPPGTGVAGVIVAVEPGEGRGGGDLPGPHTRYSCASRFFAPWMGIDEDPVTGSAHCVLAPLYDRPPDALLVGMPGERDRWRWARQCSARGGDVRFKTDCVGKRVLVAGSATTVVRGEMELPPASLA